jgi:hypothetical protein
MKGFAVGLLALGLWFVTAAPTFAHDHWGGYYGHHHHGYYVGPRVIVAVPPVYGYAGYPPYGPVVAPAYPPFVTGVPVVAPRPYYYYGAPAVTFGFRGRGIAVGVGF